jgi:hypothetical protein
MTRRLAAALVASVLLAAPDAFAGDCAEHPLNVFELEVASCEPLDATNIKNVSRWLANDDKAAKAALPGLLAQHIDRVVLEGRLKRTTQIHYPEHVVEPDEPQAVRVDAWTKGGKKGTSASFLLDGPPEVCAQYTKGAVVLLQRPTDCSCDTGPLNGRWCWLDGYRPVSEIDPYAKALLIP